jgi:hypothetical protein
MELNQSQFGGELGKTDIKPKPLNKYVKRFYPQVSEQLAIFIKQAKLAKLRRELGEN